MEPAFYHPNPAIANVFLYSWHKQDLVDNNEVTPSLRTRILLPLLAGASAGAFAKALLAPLDRIKINFQVMNQPYTIKSAIKFVLTSYRGSGIQSLWRGNTAAVIHVVPFDAIRFAAHEELKHYFGIGTDRSWKNKPGVSLLAGSLAGVIATTLTYPMDLARARMAVTTKFAYRNIIHVFLVGWKREGFFTFYRGYSASVLGVIPFSGTGFFTYEALKIFYTDVTDSKALSPAGRMAFGCASGLVGQTVSYPLDVVRRRMQVSFITDNEYKTIWRTITKIVEEEGFVRGLYKGLSLNWIKGPIAVGVTFATFDIVMEFLKLTSLFSEK